MATVIKFNGQDVSSKVAPISDAIEAAVRRNLSTESALADLEKVVKAFSSAKPDSTLRVETENGLKKSVTLRVIRSDFESLQSPEVHVESWPTRAEGAGRKARELDLSFID